MARQAVGLSQGEACYGICDRTYLSKIENGVLLPPPDILALLISRLNLPERGADMAAVTREQEVRATRRFLRDVGPLNFSVGYHHWWALREPDPPREFHQLTDRLLGEVADAGADDRPLVAHWLTEAYRYYRWRPYRGFLMRIGMERLHQLADRHRFRQLESDGRALIGHLPPGRDRAEVALALTPLVLARHGVAAAVSLAEDAEDEEAWWLESVRYHLARLAVVQPTHCGPPIRGLRVAMRPLVVAARAAGWRRTHPAEYLELLRLMSEMARLSGAPVSARLLQGMQRPGGLRARI
jgi:hypothetical protein